MLKAIAIGESTARGLDLTLQICDEVFRQSIRLTDLVFVTDLSKTTAVIAFTCCGLHMGMTQGLIAALVAQFSPAHLRGTAFGIYYLVTMTGVFLANKAAGHLGHLFGSAKGAFYGGFTWTVIALVLLALVIYKGKRNPGKKQQGV